MGSASSKCDAGSMGASELARCQKHQSNLGYGLGVGLGIPIIVGIVLIVYFLIKSDGKTKKDKFYACNLLGVCAENSSVTTFKNDPTCDGTCHPQPPSTKHYKCDGVNCIEDSSGKFDEPTCSNLCGLSSQLFGGYFPNWAQHRNPAFVVETLGQNKTVEKMNFLAYAFYYFKMPDETADGVFIPFGTTDYQLYNPEFNGSYVVKGPDGKWHPPTPEEKPVQKWTGNTELAALTDMKKNNPQLEVVLSIGGWNFHAHSWSVMVADSKARAAFINSCANFLVDFNLDGIDIDWELPGMAATDKTTQMTSCCCGRTGCLQDSASCSWFRPCDPGEGTCTTCAHGGKPDEGTCPNHDKGGSSEDFENLVTLVKEMKETFPSGKKVTIAGPASTKELAKWKLSDLNQYVDRWHVMNYDYWVSDTYDSENPSKPVLTQPNMPLQTYTSQPGSGDIPVTNSVTDTMTFYINAGIPANKLAMGLAYYGHSWWNPELGPDAKNTWKTFNQPGKVQGGCCGALAPTYGGAMAKKIPLCGSLAYMEIVDDLQNDAIVVTYHDAATSSDIAFWVSDSPTSGIKQGTWLTYSGAQSVTEAIQYANTQSMVGAFSWDLSMDDDAMTLSNAAIAALKQ